MILRPMMHSPRDLDGFRGGEVLLIGNTPLLIPFNKGWETEYLRHGEERDAWHAGNRGSGSARESAGARAEDLAWRQQSGSEGRVMETSGVFPTGTNRFLRVSIQTSTLFLEGETVSLFFTLSLFINSLATSTKL
jgi:hypothetical protein